MSARKPSATWKASTTETPGVFKRNGYYLVLTRPVPHGRKVRSRFDTYDEAVAFKAATREGVRDGSTRGLGRYAGRGGRRNHVSYLRTDPCAYCGLPGGVVDHIVPLAEGGADDWSNYTSACWRCNAQKSNHRLLVFLALRGGCFWWRRLKA